MAATLLTSSKFMESAGWASHEVFQGVWNICLGAFSKAFPHNWISEWRQERSAIR